MSGNRHSGGGGSDDQGGPPAWSSDHVRLTEQELRGVWPEDEIGLRSLIAIADTEGSGWAILPVRVVSDDDDTESVLTGLGLVLGEPLADDPLFRPVRLRRGWRLTTRMEGAGKWIEVLDDRGKMQAVVVYMTRDRSAFMVLRIDVGESSG